MRLKLNKQLLQWMTLVIALTAPLWLGSCHKSDGTNGSGSDTLPERVDKVDKVGKGDEVAKLKTEVASMRTEVDSLKGDNAKLKEQNAKMTTTIRSNRLVKISIGAVICSIILGTCYLLFGHRPGPNQANTSSASACPRCGWRIGQGDTVCGNPDCKTRFK